MKRKRKDLFLFLLTKHGSNIYQEDQVEKKEEERRKRMIQHHFLRITSLRKILQVFEEEICCSGGVTLKILIMVMGEY